MQELQYYTFEASTIDTGERKKKKKKLHDSKPLRKIQWGKLFKTVLHSLKCGISLHTIKHSHLDKHRHSSNGSFGGDH